MSSHEQTLMHYVEKTQSLLDNLPNYVIDFVEYISESTSERTQYEYTLNVRNFLSYLSANKGGAEITMQDLNSLTEDDFQKYLNHLSHYRENGNDIYNGNASIKRKLSAVRRFMQYLYQEGMIDSTEIRKIHMQKIPPGVPVPLNDEELQSIIKLIRTGNGFSEKQKDYNKIQSTRDLAIIMLLLSSGIRVSECHELDTDDIDMKNGVVRIVRYEEEFTVSFSDEITAYLNDYLDIRKKTETEETALFLSSRKTRLSTRAIENIVKKYTKTTVPGKNITPHTLRTAYAAKLYEETHDIAAVAESLGYKDIKAAREYYGSNDNNEVKK